MNRAYWFGALAALLAASGVSHGAEKVHVATPSRVIFAIPFWVAEHKGYFKDENIEATLEVVGKRQGDHGAAEVRRVAVLHRRPGCQHH